MSPLRTSRPFADIHARPQALSSEISALLGQPLVIDVRTLQDSQVYFADAAVLEKDPAALLYVARIVSQRLVFADSGLVELKKLQAAQPSSGPQELLKVGECARGATFVVNAYADQTWVDKNGHIMSCEKFHRATAPNPKKALSLALLAAAKKLLIL